MKQKALILVMVFACSILQLTAGNETKNSSNTVEQLITKNDKLSKSEMKTLVSRLHDIHASAKNNPSVEDKKKLRAEVKMINDQLNKQSGVYVYLSGAAILIILLLIILL